MSPPNTVKQSHNDNLPTNDTINNSGIEDLKTMTQNLIGAVREARMSTAHFKLQYSLLTIEASEAAERAEVEHMMTRREVEVLQAEMYKHRLQASQMPRSNHQPNLQPQIDALTTQVSDLEADRDELERKLHKAKKLIEQEQDRADFLSEENTLLKRRIRENREHFTRMKSQSPMITAQSLTTTPGASQVPASSFAAHFATPARKAAPRFPDSARSMPSGTGSHAPFAALLAADQVLSGESQSISASVPSTPTRTSHPHAKSHRQSQGHMRGAQSLSSLPQTPSRARPMTADGPGTYLARNIFEAQRMAYSAPNTQSAAMSNERDRDRHDRDSTISVSDIEDSARGGDDDNEEAVTDEELPQSQASSLATSMLRKNPGAETQISQGGAVKEQSTMLQSKLFANVGVKKAGLQAPVKGKRQASGELEGSPRKKGSEAVGLGIGTWEGTR